MTRHPEQFDRGSNGQPYDPAEPPVVRREDGSWLVEGYLDTEELKELLEVDELPSEASYQTLGGFVVMMLGRLPRVGDWLEWGSFRFEIVDMDGNRVDKVLIEPGGLTR